VMFSGILGAGFQGVQDSVRGAEGAAASIARAGLPATTSGSLEAAPSASGQVNSESVSTQPSANAQSNNNGHSDLATAMVELKVYEQSFQASAKLVVAGSDTVGFLLDVKA